MPLRDLAGPTICRRSIQPMRFFGCETRIFDPSTLPMPDSHAGGDHPAVHELRELSIWSEGQVWCSPGRHGQINGVMKLQVDHRRALMSGLVIGALTPLASSRTPPS